MSNSQQFMDPAESPRSRGPWLVALLLGICFVFVAVCGVGLIAIRALIEPSRQTVTTNEEPLEEKYAIVSAAFNSDEIGVRRGELWAIQELFDALTKAAVDSDTADTWIDHVDLERMIEQMQTSAGLPTVRSWEKTELREFLRDSITAPTNWDRATIVRVNMASGRREAQVFAALWDGESEMKGRFWITRKGRQWLLYDWDLLDYGLRATREHTLYYTLRDEVELQEYYWLKHDLSDADQLHMQGAKAEVEAALQRARGRRVPAAQADDAALQRGYTCSRLGRPSEALAEYEKIVDKPAIPGVYSGLAHVYRRREQYKLALEMADECERRLGRGDEVNGLKADILLSLDRIDEAVPELEKALRARPDQLDRVMTLARLLPDEDLPSLASYIRRMPDPDAAAEELAQSFASGRQVAALKVAIEVLDPELDSATWHYCQALLAQAEETESSVREHFRQAIAAETDDARKEQYEDERQSYWLGMGIVKEAYDEASDSAKALKTIAYAYESGEYDIDRADFEALVRMHREQHPADPWGRYAMAVLLEEDKKLAEAAVEVAAAREQAGEDESLEQIARYWHIDLLAKLGRGLEAYQLYGGTNHVFVQLAPALELKGDAESLAQLEKVAARHRASHADDPWLEYHESELAKLRGNLGEAERLLIAGRDKATDEYVKQGYASKLQMLLMKPERFYESLNFGKLDSELVDAARSLNREDRIEDLQALLVRMSGLRPNDPQTFYYQCLVDHRHKDYDALLARTLPWPKPPLGELEQAEHDELAEWATVAAVARDRIEEGEKVARDAFRRTGTRLPRLIMAIRQRRHPEIAELMEDQTYYRRNEFYNHAALTDLRLDPEFRNVRDRYPPQPNWWRDTASAVLLLKSAPEINAEQLAPQLKRPVTAIESPAESSPRSFLVGPADRQLVVALGRDRYQMRPGGETTATPAADDLLKQHQGWLYVENVPWSLDAEQGWKEVAAVLTALCEDAAALYLNEHSQLIPLDDALRKALESGDAQDKLRQRGESLWLTRKSPSEPVAMPKQSSQRAEELPTAFAARAAGKSIIARISLIVGEAEEEHWGTVERLTRNQYGAWRCTVRLKSDSKLMPHLREGEPLSLWLYDILDWREDAGSTP